MVPGNSNASTAGSETSLYPNHFQGTLSRLILGSTTSSMGTVYQNTLNRYRGHDGSRAIDFLDGS